MPTVKLKKKEAIDKVVLMLNKMPLYKIEEISLEVYKQVKFHLVSKNGQKPSVKI